MRKIIVTEFITLDGVVEAPGGNETPHPHAGWSANRLSLLYSSFNADMTARESM